jgi:transcriptional regulator with XRE-family HTH domain
MEDILKRMANLRKDKGISHEAMAANLELSQAAYSKIEKGETKLSVDRLYKIAEILNSSVEELMGFQSKHSQEIKNNDIKENEQFIFIAHQEIENLFQEKKEISDKLIKHLEDLVKSKDQLIEVLKSKLTSKK